MKTASISALIAIIFLFLSSAATAQDSTDDPIAQFFADHRTKIEKIADNPALMKEYVLSQKDVNARQKDGKTLLHYAANRGHLDVAALLLQKGAHIDSQDNDGKTPLHEAMAYSRFPVARLLLEKGANVNLKDNDGDTPLISIVYLDNKKLAVDLVHLFLRQGFDVAKSADARLLSETIRRRHPEVALVLLDRGCAFNDGALADAAAMGYDDVFAALLGKGAELKQDDALHAAAAGGNLNIAKLLVERGKKPRPEDVDFALYKGHIEVAAYLNEVLKKAKGQGIEMRRRCSLKPEDGPCKALFFRGYYNTLKNSCEEFVYGGCGGEVPFESVEACRRVCEEGPEAR